jgi:hypothetical protein
MDLVYNFADRAEYSTSAVQVGVRVRRVRRVRLTLTLTQHSTGVVQIG